MNFIGIHLTLLVAVGIFASAGLSMADCGGSLEVPRDHFDGVDAQGYVSYWDKIADIDIGEDTPMPLVIGFKSNRETSSPYLGHGWVMPLLDSYMIQTGENTFEIMKPTGYTSGFGRDPKSPTTIGGVKGWKGEIGSNAIKVWAPCGWNLTYTMGRLTEIGTPKGKRVLVKRDQAGQVEDVTMDGIVLVKVLKSLGGKVDGIEVEGNKFAFTLDEKPRVQSVQGKNMVVGKDWSVVRISSESDPSHLIRGFEYEVDNALQPTMNVKQAGQPVREIVWNAANGTILKDGEWTYDIKASKTPGENAALARTDGRNKEYWYRDTTSGKEETQGVDGETKITRWFTSGALAGQIRSESTTRHGLMNSEKRYFYGENGNLLRSASGLETRTYEADGGIRQINLGGIAAVVMYSE